MVCKFLFVLFFIKYASTLKCHVCNSQLSLACLDPFNITETLQECEGTGGRFGGGGKLLDMVDVIMQTGASGVVEGDDAASKAPTRDREDNGMVCQKIVVVVGNDSITGRGCSPVRVDGMHPCDAVRLSAPGSVRHCVTCPSDACNAAGAVLLSPAVVILVAGYAYYRL